MVVLVWEKEERGKFWGLERRGRARRREFSRYGGLRGLKLWIIFERDRMGWIGKELVWENDGNFCSGNLNFSGSLQGKSLIYDKDQRFEPLKKVFFLIKYIIIRVKKTISWFGNGECLFDKIKKLLWILGFQVWKLEKFMDLSHEYSILLSTDYNYVWRMQISSHKYNK
jgi:hypothetical protein